MAIHIRRHPSSISTIAAVETPYPICVYLRTMERNVQELIGKSAQTRAEIKKRKASRSLNSRADRRRNRELEEYLHDLILIARDLNRKYPTYSKDLQSRAVGRFVDYLLAAISPIYQGRCRVFRVAGPHRRRTVPR